MAWPRPLCPLRVPAVLGQSRVSAHGPLVRADGAGEKGAAGTSPHSLKRAEAEGRLFR